MRIFFFLFMLFQKTFSVHHSRISSFVPFNISLQNSIFSPSRQFKLGFFKPSLSFEVHDRWYIGLWSMKLPNEVVWVANRNNPVMKPTRTLQFLKNNLHFHDQDGRSVWSTNISSQSLVRSLLIAELRDDGNLVLRYSNNKDSGGFLWQSFDFPTDTLLPGMKMGWETNSGKNRLLQSWKTRDDPSPGDFTYKVEIRETPESYIRVQGKPICRSDPWNNEIVKFEYGTGNLTVSSEEVSYSFNINNASFFSILRMSYNGVLNRSTWIPTSGDLNRVGELLPNEPCDYYNKCGPNGLCDRNTLPVCNCMKGFMPKYQEAWDLRNTKKGCKRKTQTKCFGDGFSKLRTMKLPDTTDSIVDFKIGLKECKENCLKNCNCTAYANANMQMGGLGCIIWLGELIDLRRNKIAGQDLYVRMDSNDIGEEGNNKHKVVIIISVVVGLVLLLLLVFTTLFVWKRRKRERSTTRTISASIGTVQLVPMQLHNIAVATQNFSHKIGEGGFGIVYKGRLLDGQQIAAKRLFRRSVQRIDGFRNELTLIASVQHVNLVQLLGYCFEGDEMILIYEYLENGSLDTYLFDKRQSSKLNWEKRFKIANGIARGLLYLHQDSRLRIVHRDMKPSNILLDKDMIPKISDFGMGKIFDKGENQANTTKIVGTYGYMSLEYSEDGIYSTKSDVFSFGILILEIICGKRNTSFYKNSNDEESLLDYIWKHWEEGKGLEIVDPVIVDSSTYRPQEVARCIKIGLLCVQERAEDRPAMLSVFVMLTSDTTEIAQPGPPAYMVRKIPLEAGSSSRGNEDYWSVAEVTFSAIEARLYYFCVE